MGRHVGTLLTYFEFFRYWQYLVQAAMKFNEIKKRQLFSRKWRKSILHTAFVVVYGIGPTQLPEYTNNFVSLNYDNFLAASHSKSNEAPKYEEHIFASDKAFSFLVE